MKRTQWEKSWTEIVAWGIRPERCFLFEAAKEERDIFISLSFVLFCPVSARFGLFLRKTLEERERERERDEERQGRGKERARTCGRGGT